MLRRKLLARLGLLVVGFVAGAVVAIVLLQGVLRDLDAMNADATAMIDGVQDLSTVITSIETELYEEQGGRAPDVAALARDAASLRLILDALGEHPVMRPPGGEGSSTFQSIRALVAAFVPAATIPGEPARPSREGLGASVALRQEVAELGRIARLHVGAEQAALSRDLRLLIIGLTLAALAMVNITVVVLLRTANMILRPVGALVEGSRQLAREKFDYRVEIDQNDEFAELARAYNMLAAQLAANERRKIETLQQLALSLNHELNNVISIIDLQLRLMDRRSGGDPTLAKHLREIHANLGRMTQTVASLREVRRIVLTDYVPGQKMLDLERSAAPGDGPTPPPPPAPPPQSEPSPRARVVGRPPS